MRKLFILAIGATMILAFAACKSSESAYKKAYEKAKQQELTETTDDEVTPVEVTPVVVETQETSTQVADANVRQEKVTFVSGANNLKAYNVVVGSFGVKANAEGLKDWLDNEGYQAIIAYNAEKSMYRVIVGSYSEKASAISARNTFKAKYPNRTDFQGAWLLYVAQ